MGLNLHEILPVLLGVLLANTWGQLPATMRGEKKTLNQCAARENTFQPRPIKKGTLGVCSPSMLHVLGHFLLSCKAHENRKVKQDMKQL